jgi:hypothetical protein
MYSIWSIPEIRQLIYLFDRTHHEFYQKCMQEIKKNGLLKTLWFTDFNDNNLDYKIIPCMSRVGNKECSSHGNCECKGELIVKGNGNDMMLNLSNVSYHLLEFVSSYGSDEDGTYAAFDLSEFVWSLQKKLSS